ncbi:OmpA family protein [Corallococcus macrosporus]|uniref:OmpA family protein n=1 Tax=Myxococcus fulvus (strain ATCC BAA-855 / HW-1) TaxID=483219 RepID=F8CID8_MYXFH|nr:OmpA family protein [Corallococcus macrosporus]AEI63797.1 OmpA family protein [Corallococcus macrosporus]
MTTRALHRWVLLAAVLGAFAPGCRHAPDLNPALDADGDGVLNGEDACPTARGLARLQGCPAKDTDGDGVEDARDACPRVFGPLERQGCPVEDPDRDGVEGAADKCPDEPGPASREGCPIRDADGDGVPDEEDACPTEEGLPALRGCPERDMDGDSVPDHRDNCPRERGAADNQGCPAARKQRVGIRPDRLELLERITFVPGTATLHPRVQPVLDNVAEVLLAHPRLGVIAVEGHTDNRGDPEVQREMTRARAEVVRDYLVERGVPADRLEAWGFGPDRPVGSNETSQGRAANRRLDLRIVTPRGGP